MKSVRLQGFGELKIIAKRDAKNAFQIQYFNDFLLVVIYDVVKNR